ncbi:MAG: ATP-binding protein [Chloroflexota bacterium]|nr:ATP-binding protein [Chloroflexota bacterium]MDE2894887.1 ATP-binding protein [Chloroflexota bacterium]
MNERLHPRVAIPSLERRLRVMPVAVVTGARQTGKSTLVQQLGSEQRRYVTLDDLDVRSAARDDPALLVDGPQPITIDEVQREPELLHAVKRAVDRQRRPGQFLLTGSANLLLMHRVSESLAGRASYLNLWPMSRRELHGLGPGGIWERLFETRPSEWIDLLRSEPNEPEDWRALARRGGFPVPALQLENDEDRAIWFDGYVRTYLERDLQDLSNISALPEFRRLMRAACLRVGQLLNQSALARDISLAQATAFRYLNLLETSFLFVRLPAYASNRTKRLVKTPKAYWSDTGLAMHLSQETEPRGEHLENMVLHDLLVWRDCGTTRAEIFYWRTSNNQEVDFVIEQAGRLLPIEVKSGATPRLRDARHLRVFLDEYQDISDAGLLLHDGDMPEWIAPNVLAAPWWMLI